jgi:hypothetical protein
MDVAFCIDALDETLARFGRPEIFNTDQGSQFTSALHCPLAGNTVDMTLRLDDAAASPICPQPPQQQQSILV